MKKGALFDMDGLLFDTEKLFQETWNEIAAELGIVLDSSFKFRICGTSGDLSYRIVEEYYKVPDGKPINDEVHRRVHEKLTVSIPEKPGMREILEMFRKNGVPMALASSTEQPSIDENLKVAGIDFYFDAVVSGAGLPHGKPAPDIFLLAAEKIGIAPGDCYVFEDSVSGIMAAHAGGMTPVMVPDLVEPTEEICAMCGGIFRTLNEAAAAIEQGLL